MRVLLAAATLAALLACAAPASAATIYTFGLSNGTGASPGSIVSFSFDPLGAGGTLTVLKELDAFTVIVSQAVALGTIFPGATFGAYTGTVTPGTRIFEYVLTNALFSSVQFGGGEPPLETFQIVSETVTMTRGPAPVPEPATLFLMATGAALALRRRRTC